MRLSSPKAKIFVNGELKAHQSSLDLGDLEPGNYKIRFEEEGYENFETMQFIRAGDTPKITHQMVKVEQPKPEPEVKPQPRVNPKPRPKAATKGKLTVTIIGGGWANVFVDGKKLPKTAPLSDYPIAAGSHTVKVENAALGLSHTETVNVSGGGSVTVKASP